MHNVICFQVIIGIIKSTIKLLYQRFRVLAKTASVYLQKTLKNSVLLSEPTQSFWKINLLVITGASTELHLSQQNILIRAKVELNHDVEGSNNFRRESLLSLGLYSFDYIYGV